MEQPIVVLAQPLYGYISADAHLRQMSFFSANCHRNYHWYRDSNGVIRCVPQNDLASLAKVYPGDHGPIEVRPLLCGYFARCKGYIDWARNDCIEQILFRHPEVSHILFMDQDMDLPDMAVRDLLLADKDIVSGIYFKKEEAAAPVGYASLDPPEPLETFNENGLQQVAGIGFGCALVKTDVFRKMQSHFGGSGWTEWFKIERSAGVNRGEDFWFSAKAAEIGIPIYIDGRVRCEHIGDKAYTIDDYHRAKTRKKASERCPECGLRGDHLQSCSEFKGFSQ